jgi:hypothetical protein
MCMTSSRANIFFLGGRRFFVLFFRINFFCNPRQNYFLRTSKHKCLLVLKQARGTSTLIVEIAFFYLLGKLTAVTFLFFIITVGTFLQYQHTRICSPSYLFKFKFTSACSLTVLQPSITIPTPEVLLLSF